MAHATEQMISREMRVCIENCLECYAICEETKAHCLAMGGKHAELAHIRTLADCARLCETSANMMLRGSEFHGRVCEICAEACDRCAASCEQIGGNDEIMLQCVQVCRRCAASCKEMAGS